MGKKSKKIRIENATPELIGDLLKVEYKSDTRTSLEKAHDRITILEQSDANMHGQIEALNKVIDRLADKLGHRY